MFTDNIAKKDLLNRETFAKNIADGLFKFTQRNSDGFVTAITGKWGSGKSTLVSFVLKNLKPRFEKSYPNYAFVEFNPWMFSQKDEISTSFLQEYMKAFEGYEELTKEKKKEIFKRKLAKGVASAFSYTKEIANEIDASLKKYTTQTSLTFKKEIDNLLVDSNRKIIVCIDDIDRLPPKQIFELLQLLKLTCNFKNTFYLIAYDREAVELAIDSQFKNYGKKFLDKIVQAEFLVPEIPQEKVREIFFYEIEKLLASLNCVLKTRELVSVWNYKKLKHYFTTLRDVYRYVNSLRFSLPLINNEINSIDFLILEAIRLNDFDVYKMIFNEYGKIVFSFGDPDIFINENNLEKIGNITTKNLVTYLFPQKPNVHSNRGKKRIYQSAYFERYFTLQINKHDVFQSELEIVIDNTMNRVDFLKRILKEDRFDNFLSRFIDEIELRNSNEWNFDLINDLMIFFSNNAEEVKPDQLSDTIVLLLNTRQDEKEEYFRLFVDTLLTNTNYFDKARIYFYHYLLSFEAKRIEIPSLWFDLCSYCMERIDPLEKYYLNFLRKWAGQISHDNKLENPKSFYVKIFIQDYSSFCKEDYKRLLENLLTEKDSLFTYCYFLLGDLKDGPQRINIESLNIYLPDEMQNIFFKKLKELDKSFLSRNELKAIKILTDK